MGQKRRHDEFRESMKSLLQTGKHSDFTIVCGDDTYKVHKSIVCSQCDFLDAASRFGREAEEGKIDLVDDEPEIVKYMIQYLYELDYHLPSEETPGPWAFQLDWKEEPGSYFTHEKLQSPEVRREWDQFLWQTSATMMGAVVPKYPDICAVSLWCMMIAIEII
jgi:hypothetical protein